MQHESAQTVWTVCPDSFYFVSFWVLFFCTCFDLTIYQNIEMFIMNPYKTFLKIPLGNVFKLAIWSC